MIKYFELLLDLLEIEDKENYIKIANIIESNPWKKLEIYHQHAPIFLWYKSLISGNQSIEDFLKIWDINSDILYNSQIEDSVSFFQKKKNIDDNTIYIFDSISYWGVDWQNIYYC